MSLSPLKKFAKSLYFRTASQSQVLARRLTYLKDRNAIVVLNLHRVAPPDQSTYRPLTPALFEELVEFCSRHFRISTFSNLDKTYRGAQLGRVDKVDSQIT